MQKYEVQKEFNGSDETLLGHQAKGTILSDDTVSKDYLETLKGLGYITEKGNATKQIQEDVKSMDDQLVGTVVGGDETEGDETVGETEGDDELKNEAGIIDNTVVVGSDETEDDVSMDKDTPDEDDEGDDGVDLDDEVKSSTEEVGTETLAEKLQKATTKDELKALAKTQKGLVDATKWNKSVDAIKADLIASAQ